MKKIENQIDLTTIQSSWNFIAKIIITWAPYSSLSSLIMLIVGEEVPPLNDFSWHTHKGLYAYNIIWRNKMFVVIQCNAMARIEWIYFET